jgi:hypothetical protein
MPRFELLWGEYAGEQFNSLPLAAQRAVMDAVADVQDDPAARGSYDEATDWYTTHFASEGVAGLIVYVVGERHCRVVILRVTLLI